MFARSTTSMTARRRRRWRRATMRYAMSITCLDVAHPWRTSRIKFRKTCTTLRVVARAAREWRYVRRMTHVA